MPPKRFKPVEPAAPAAPAAPVVAEPVVAKVEGPRPSVTHVRLGNGAVRTITRKRAMPAMIDWQQE